MTTTNIESTKVIIKTIPRDTASKISEFRNGVNGKKMNRTKLGRCKDTIRALGSNKLGGNLLTGLDKVVNNPYYKTQKDLPKEFDYLKEQETATLQEILEVKHKRPKGYYTNRAWQPSDGYKGENLTFFQKFKVALNDGATILDLSNPLEEISYYLLKASPKVAESNKPEDRQKKPKADFYIADKNESIQEKFTKKKLYNEAATKLNDPKFTPSYQRKLTKILGLIKGDATTIPDEQIYLFLDTFIEDGLKGKEDNLNQFLDTYKLTQSAEGRNELEALVLLEDLVTYRLVSDSRGTYTWISKQIVIGQRKAEAVDFLLDPKKQPERDELERQLKAKLIR